MRNPRLMTLQGCDFLGADAGLALIQSQGEDTQNQLWYLFNRDGLTVFNGLADALAAGAASEPDANQGSRDLQVAAAIRQFPETVSFLTADEQSALIQAYEANGPQIIAAAIALGKVTPTQAAVTLSSLGVDPASANTILGQVASPIMLAPDGSIVDAKTGAVAVTVAPDGAQTPAGTPIPAGTPVDAATGAPSTAVTAGLSLPVIAALAGGLWLMFKG